MLLHRIITMISFNNIQYLLCNRSWIIIYLFPSLDIPEKQITWFSIQNCTVNARWLNLEEEVLSLYFPPLYVFKSTYGRNRTLTLNELLPPDQYKQGQWWLTIPCCAGQTWTQYMPEIVNQKANSVLQIINNCKTTKKQSLVRQPL